MTAAAEWLRLEVMLLHEVQNNTCRRGSRLSSIPPSTRESTEGSKHRSTPRAAQWLRGTFPVRPERDTQWFVPPIVLPRICTPHTLCRTNPTNTEATNSCPGLPSSTGMRLPAETRRIDWLLCRQHNPRTAGRTCSISSINRAAAGLFFIHHSFSSHAVFVLLFWRPSLLCSSGRYLMLFNC